MTAPTPMMEQYWRVKDDNPGSLLFFRMGDFYELFFDDAVTASAALDIALTQRGKHQGADVPMCGVPVNNHDGYVARLIRKGFKVAICEQVEDPAAAKKRGPKAVVERAVVRVVTAGTLTEDTLLESRTHNFLAALARAGAELGLAWVDISTGAFCVQPVKTGDVAATLAALDPGEILAPENGLDVLGLGAVIEEWRRVMTLLPPSRFDSVNGRQRLLTQFNVATLDAFGDFSRAEIAAGGALVDYIELTQKGRVPRLSLPSRIIAKDYVQIDSASRRNLELVRSLSGGKDGSLLHVIDRTVTGSGARLLHSRLAAPLTDTTAIDKRLDQVSYFVDCEAIRQGVRTLLRRCPDMERALSRLAVGRGGPRDLAAIRDGLSLGMAVKEACRHPGPAPEPAEIKQLVAELGNHTVLVDELKQALVETLPVAVRDGDFIAAGYDERLDELRALRDQSRRLIAELQARYAKDTTVNALKIRHNNVLGYFIEVPARYAEKITEVESQDFILRQSMANALRFKTTELDDLERRISEAAAEAMKLEAALFDNFVSQVLDYGQDVAKCAAALAALDVVSALADLATDYDYCRPHLDSGPDLKIIGGRHPVVEAALRRDAETSFIPNDCQLVDGQKIWLLTGPNMAGKSTFLRQAALIVLLAQMGSFVPAESAHIGVVDRIFSRVGAADDLARGQSTFMVEMVETAAILHQAGERSLVILDEIGRGTATFDGLSIAWAVVEYLHNTNRCRALFATHYRELTALAATLGDLACFSMRVREWKGDVVFLHEVAPGAANRSYGIHVGRLAGLPSAVVRRAQQVLKTLENGEAASAPSRLAEDLPLFAVRVNEPTATPPGHRSPVEAQLEAVDPDSLTPREALDLIYVLKNLSDDSDRATD